jgi:hypothetical protein
MRLLQLSLLHTLTSFRMATPGSDHISATASGSSHLLVEGDIITLQLSVALFFGPTALEEIRLRRSLDSYNF